MFEFSPEGLAAIEFFLTMHLEAAANAPCIIDPELRLSPELYSAVFENTLLDYAMECCRKHPHFSWHISDLSEVNRLTHLLVSLLTDSLPANGDTIRSVYHYAVPTTKLYYPEPFIAAPSFLHTDLGFSHITVYMYGLGFAFCFLITFFFITFVCTLRGCNPRIRPRRETRGVSRSKCGDLITAIVPVSGATSIIIHESTDSIDLYDGSGTNELSVGIRAYQGGGEYYYPRTIDLNHRLQSYGIYGLGSSYVNSPNLSHLNEVHRFLNEYQARNDDGVNESGALLFLPHLNPFGLPFFDLTQSGRNTRQENSAFQSMHQLTKHVRDDLSTIAFFDLNTIGFDKLFVNDAYAEGAYNIKADRPHLYMSNFGVLNAATSLSDLRSFAHMRDSWQANQYSANLQFSNFDSLNYFHDGRTANINLVRQLLSATTSQASWLLSQTSFVLSSLGRTYGRLMFANINSDEKLIDHIVLSLTSTSKAFQTVTLNEFSVMDSVYKEGKKDGNNFKIFKNMAGSAPQLSERSVRNFPIIDLEANNIKRDVVLNALFEHVQPILVSTFLTSANLVTNANIDFVSASSLLRTAHVNFSLPVHNPAVSSNPFLDIRNYDLLQNSATSMLRLYHGREDMISELITDIYKDVGTTSDSWMGRVNNALYYYSNINNTTWPLHTSYFDADFRKGASNQLTEDCYGDAYFNNQGGDVIADYIFNRKLFDAPRDKFVRYIMTIRFKHLLKNSTASFHGLRGLHKPFLTVEYPNAIPLEESRLQTELLSLIIQNDEGLLNTQILPRSGQSAAFVSSSGLISLDDAYLSGKQLNQHFSNFNIPIINKDAGLLRLQNLITMFDIFSMSYDYPSVFVATLEKYSSNLLEEYRKVSASNRTAERRYNRGFKSLYFPHPLFIRYFIRYFNNYAYTPHSIPVTAETFNQFRLPQTTTVVNNLRQDVLPGNFYKHNSYQSSFLTAITDAELMNLSVNNREIDYPIFDQFINGNLTENATNQLRIPASFKLLSNVSHAATSYNAVQKVYRTQYDEARSNIRLRDVAMSYQPVYRLSEKKFDFMHLIKKNSDSFYQPIYSAARKHGPLSTLYAYQTSIDTRAFDFPFRLAVKSDPARYLGIDGGANGGVVDIQPASFSKYALYGLPVFAKAFEYSAPENDTFTEGENYLTRVARARRSLLSSGVTTPYFYAKANHGFVNYNILELLVGLRGGLSFFDQACNICYDFLTDESMLSSAANDLFTYFFPALSLNGSPARKAGHTYDTVNSYYYHGTRLADILTKRELLMRNLLLSKNSLVKLPFHYTASPAHPLFKDLRAGLLFSDAQMNSMEATHAAFNSNKLSFEFFAVQTFYEYLATLCPYSTLTNYLMSLIMSTQQTPARNSGLDSVVYRTDIARRSQYRSIKRGVSNMVRLHATGAMALPVVTRLHIFASSRDVIHSGAIPSAGIKIDCIPGFSSHRMAYFISTGIFGGQCMEVCGRYHHGMPIVVYFMKKDIFLLGCTHFVFLKHETDVLELLDQHSTDFVRTVSHEPENGLSEFDRTTNL